MLTMKQEIYLLIHVKSWERTKYCVCSRRYNSGSKKLVVGKTNCYMQNILYCMGMNNYLHLNIKPAFHQKNSFEKKLKFKRDFIIYRKKRIKIFKIQVEEDVSHRNMA